MTFELTVSATDWSAVGAVPSRGHLELGLLNPALSAPITTSKRWTITLDEAGTGSWEVPTIPADNALVVRSRVSGLWQGRTFYFADPGAGVHSLSELVARGEVDPKTLQPSEEGLAGWTAAVVAAGSSAAAASASAGFAQDARVQAEDSAARAASSALEATVSVGEAADSATEAGTSALNAEQSAAVALGHANDAGTSAAEAATTLTYTEALAADVDSGLAAKANTADLAAVATSGDYGDLTGTPSLTDNLDGTATFN